MRSVLILSLCLIALALVPGAPLRADIVILEYDDKGRVVGARRTENGAKAGGKAGERAVPAATGRRDLPGPAAVRYERSEVLAVNPPNRFEAELARLGFRVIERVTLSEFAIRLYRLRVPPGVAPPEAKRQLEARFPGLVVDLNHRYEPSAAPADHESHARARIGWPPVGGSCGRGVRLGMIDTAIDISHPALKGENVEYRSFHNPDRAPGAADHGTGIAAMMVGQGGWGGLLPGVELKAANMFEVDEQGKTVGNGVGLLKALNWIARARVHAINLSIAGPDNKVLRLVFDRARRMGLVMVAAAGNWASADRPAYPAAYVDVVAVTAVNGKRAIYRYANRGRYIDFAAPGVAIWTAVPGGGRFQSGTSFATPYITILLALEVVRGTAPNPGALRDVLRRHTIDLGQPGRDDVFGWGLIKMPRRCVG